MLVGNGGLTPPAWLAGATLLATGAGCTLTNCVFGLVLCTTAANRWALAWLFATPPLLPMPALGLACLYACALTTLAGCAFGAACTAGL